MNIPMCKRFSVIFISFALLASCATHTEITDVHKDAVNKVVLKTGELKVSSSSWINAEDLSLGVLPSQGEEGESGLIDDDTGLSSSENIAYDAFFDIEKQQRLISALQLEVELFGYTDNQPVTIVIHFLRIEQSETKQTITYTFDTDISVFNGSRLTETKQLLIEAKSPFIYIDDRLDWLSITKNVADTVKTKLIYEVKPLGGNT